MAKQWLVGKMLTDSATFHPWMNVFHTPRFLQAWVILCFSGVMAALSRAESRIPLDQGISYTQVCASVHHTVLLRSDGSAVACGNNLHGHCDIPPLDEGMSYAQVSAAEDHTVLLRSDGTCVFCGTPDVGQCDIPTLRDGLMTYVQISAGGCHSVFHRSDGHVVACGFNCSGECDIPPLNEALSIFSCVHMGSRRLRSASVWLRAAIFGGGIHLDVVFATQLVGVLSRTQRTRALTWSSVSGTPTRALNDWLCSHGWICDDTWKWSHALSRSVLDFITSDDAGARQHVIRNAWRAWCLHKHCH